MPNRLLALSLIWTIIASAALSAGCERHRKVPPLSDAEIEELTRDQPPIFLERNGALTLEGVEKLYLGQSYDEAMEVLDEYCEVIKVFDGGWRHSNAVFKGCNVYDGENSRTLRAGFWPFNDNRVSTLEIQSQVIAQPVLRARFSQFADELTQDLPRRGILMMASTRHRLVASWDEGLDEPAHIVIGFHPP